ncbi:DNA-binding protein, partial [Vibrio parahaemolyticus]
GSYVPKFLLGLANIWNHLVPTILSSANSLLHVTQLIGGLTERSLKSISRDFEELSAFVSENLSDILISSPELNPERFAWLNFDVKDFELIQDHPDVVNTMFEQGLFELTVANLEFAYLTILGLADLEALRTRNYTTIRTTGSTILMDKIERNFDEYLSNILLTIPTNTEENTSAILDVIYREEIDSTAINEFLKQQTKPLPKLECVPERLHAKLFQLNMIAPSWENCLSFMESEGFETESLVRYLDNDAVRSVILEQTIPSD